MPLLLNLGARGAGEYLRALISIRNKVFPRFLTLLRGYDDREEEERR
ncbi:MAG: hypothetical protein ACE5IO_03875 [Thermoplasmata archaeon]